MSADARLRLFVAARHGGRALALVDDRRLIEYRLDRPGSTSRIGEIHLGRVQRVESGLDAAFVDIAAGRPALLPLADAPEPPRAGDAVLVQVTRDAREEKGCRVSARPALTGRSLVWQPHHPGISVSQRIGDADEAARLTAAIRGFAAPGEGFVARAAAAGRDPATLAAEAQHLRDIWRMIEAAQADARPPACLRRDSPVLSLLWEGGAAIEEIVADSRGAAEALGRELPPDLAARVVFRPARDWVPGLDEIDEQIEAALEPTVPLASGGALLIEPGRTLTAIDVNSGGSAADGGGRRPGERRLLDANLQATQEIARQLRLRNIGGIVVIDFIDLKSAESRGRVVSALRRALAGDPAPCRVGRMSELGLVEMTRRRRGPSLAELLTRECAACGGIGRVAAPLDGGEGPL